MPHTLLLADDSVTIQRVIELTFADEDVRVIAVGDGRQAIDRIESDRPDIVLADVGMPVHDGYEVAAFVKARPELAHIPVLLLTGAFEPIDEGRARSAGCDGVLVKPFEPQMVIHRVKDLLAGRRPDGLWDASAPARAAQPSPPPRSPGDAPTHGRSDPSLEDYFERLDAAFAGLGSTAPLPDAGPAGVSRSPSPAPPGSADVQAAPTPYPASVPATPGPQPPPAAHGAGQVAPATPPAPRTSLAAAFAALLAAEQDRPIAPASVRPEDIPEETIEDIVRRVIDRLGTSTVQNTLVDVAERMVREEIERIKRGG